MVAQGQKSGRVEGKILDPTGAVIPGAEIMLTAGSQVLKVQSTFDGSYVFMGVPPGSYTLAASAKGFGSFSQAGVVVAAGQIRHFDISLAIAIQRQSLTVKDQNLGANVNPDENASQIDIQGSQLDALSDNPDELQSELQALAGPAAGPNGGQIYINGFASDQLPPKSSIREIRINEDPFSAEFDTLGYGRIEIFTKPGSNKFSGHLVAAGNDSAWNTANPFLANEPGYYTYYVGAGAMGPLSKEASYNINALRLDEAAESIVDGINPTDTSQALHLAVPIPYVMDQANPRLDLQLGKNNTLTLNYSFYRSAASGKGVGELNLPQQAISQVNLENTLQVMNSWIVNSHMVNDTRFQWRRIRMSQTPAYLTPAVTVEGAFTTGGSSEGATQDHEDIFNLQNYWTVAVHAHTLNFGARLRAYRDANYSNTGANGSYLFSSIGDYLAGEPTEYQQTVVENPLAHLLMADAALFYQDDWRWKPNLTLSYGLRFETQNRIHDHADWAPRLALAWAPGGMKHGKHPQTVIRAGYGWFYDRFIRRTSFGAAGAAPYLIQTIHQNGLNQQSYVIANPGFYDPSAPLTPSQIAGTTASIPSIYTLDPHFHAALSMQAAVGIDRSLGKAVLLNVTYLYTRGVHQYLTNNVTAPAFDISTYTVVGAQPSIYNYQFQSGGVYKQHEIILTVTTHFRHLSLHSAYTFNHAMSDTQGVSYVPSVASNPGFDYGRASFGNTSRFFLIGTYSAPYGIVVAPEMAAQSGTPYNLVIGSDLTANNQFNARPSYGVCGAMGVVSTPYGCLDTDPIGKGEKIVPYGLGTGPSNFSMFLRVSKVIGIGPRITRAAGGGIALGGSGVSGRGLSGSQARMKFNAAAKRRYSLTLTVGTSNLFNIVNLAPPNGTLNSPLFGTSQSLAGGAYGSPTQGNRTILASALFKF